VAGVAQAEAPDLDSLLASLEVPEEVGFDLAHWQRELNAAMAPAPDARLGGLTSVGGAGAASAGREGPLVVPETYGDGSRAENDRRVLETLASGAVLTPRPEGGRVSVGGPDARRFLTEQTTTNVSSLPPGRGTTFVVTDARGRALCGGLVLVLPSSCLLLTDARDEADRLTSLLDSRIFRGDAVSVRDVSADTVAMCLCGPEAAPVLAELGVADDFLTEGPPRYPDGSHVLLGLPPSPGAAANAPPSAPVVVARGLAGSGGPGMGLAPLPGFVLIVGEEGCAELFRLLMLKGCVPGGSRALGWARGLLGSPGADEFRPPAGKDSGAEGDDAYDASSSDDAPSDCASAGPAPARAWQAAAGAPTPLELGLGGAVDVNKGCATGQETLTRQAGVGWPPRRMLAGVRLARGETCARGDEVRTTETEGAPGRLLGRVSSVVPEGPAGWGAGLQAAAAAAEGACPAAGARHRSRGDGALALALVRARDPATGLVWAGLAGGGRVVVVGADGRASPATMEWPLPATRATLAAGAWGDVRREPAAGAIDAAAEATRKASKLAEMEARLAAFQMTKQQGEN